MIQSAEDFLILHMKKP